MKVTADVVMALNPCVDYPRARVARILRGKGLLDALLSVPPADARWLVARLLTPEDREHWVYACADRAARYCAEGTGDYADACAADAASCAAAAAYAAYAAYTAYAAAYAYAAYTAYAAAYAYAAYAAEHRTAMEMAAAMIEEMP